MFVVVAYRFANVDLHSYVVGIFNDFDRAIEVAIKEEEYRGGKYYCRVLNIEPDVYDPEVDHEVVWESVLFVDVRKSLKEDYAARTNRN
jgi:hypothetical protein